MKQKIQRWLASPRLPLALAIAAFVLTLPALGIGWLLDDEFHRSILTERGPAEVSPWQLFSGPPPDPALHSAFVDRGVFPWWASDDFRLSLFRPLSVVSARLDYWLWPESAPLMHLHSLLWFAALIAAATVLYRRLLAPGWLAGFAALLYAIDDAHAPPASWIANRNALLGCLFGLLCLIAHDRWRREGSRGAGIAAPLLLATALASGEAALGAVAFLAAYALCREPGGWRERLTSLLPSGAVILVWTTLYRLGGYGAHGSGSYIDPLGSPLAYAAAFVRRAPFALLGQWSPIPADVGTLLPPERLGAAWWLAVSLAALLAVLLGPLLRHDSSSRFWLVGMFLALFPISAVFPSNRLLFFVGLGAMPLLAHFLSGLASKADWLPSSRAWRALAYPIAVLLTIVHLPLAFALMPIGPLTVRQSGELPKLAAATLPADTAISRQELILVNAPDYLMFVTHIPTLQILEDRPVPLRVRALSTGPSRVEVSRPDERTLRVRVEDGLYSGVLGRLFRDHEAELAVGDEVRLTGLNIRVAGLDERGDPSEILYRFDSPLEDSKRRWIHWVDGAWEEFALPVIGERRRLEPPKGPLDLFY